MRAVGSRMYFGVLILILSLFIGCGPHKRTAQQVTIPRVGNIQRFDVTIYNGNLWPIFVSAQGFQGGSQGIVVQGGRSITVPIGFLPSSVTVTAYTMTTPAQQIGPLSKYVGIDYSYWATGTDFRIYNNQIY